MYVWVISCFFSLNTMIHNLNWYFFLNYIIIIFPEICLLPFKWTAILHNLISCIIEIVNKFPYIFKVNVRYLVGFILQILKMLLKSYFLTNRKQNNNKLSLAIKFYLDFAFFFVFSLNIIKGWMNLLKKGCGMAADQLKINNNCVFNYIYFEYVCMVY